VTLEERKTGSCGVTADRRKCSRLGTVVTLFLRGRPLRIRGRARMRIPAPRRPGAVAIGAARLVTAGTAIHHPAGGQHTRAGGTHARAGGTHARVGGAHARAGGAHARAGGAGARVGGAWARAAPARPREGATVDRMGPLAAWRPGPLTGCSRWPRVGRRRSAVAGRDQLDRADRRRRRRRGAQRGGGNRGRQEGAAISRPFVPVPGRSVLDVPGAARGVRGGELGRWGKEGRGQTFRGGPVGRGA